LCGHVELEQEKAHKLWLSLEDGAGKLFILLTFYSCMCCVNVLSLSREKSRELWLSLKDGAGKLFIVVTLYPCRCCVDVSSLIR
jgi:hypothetical protein